jgi:hypothetical protein
MHYERWRLKGDIHATHQMPTRRRPDLRFWAKVDTTAGLFECWPWLGARDDDGYGRFRRGGCTEGMVSAHRFALEQVLGRNLGPGMVARHVVCDNPPCCNPAHLAEGTHADNADDKVSKGRQARGERHGQTRLTPGQVLAIRAAYRAGVTQTALGKVYGMTQAGISRIVLRQTWVDT